jgi:hypothetical protein
MVDTVMGGYAHPVAGINKEDTEDVYLIGAHIPTKSLYVWRRNPSITAILDDIESNTTFFAKDSRFAKKEKVWLHEVVVPNDPDNDYYYWPHLWFQTEVGENAGRVIIRFYEGGTFNPAAVGGDDTGFSSLSLYNRNRNASETTSLTVRDRSTDAKLTDYPTNTIIGGTLLWEQEHYQNNQLNPQSSEIVILKNNTTYWFVIVPMQKDVFSTMEHRVRERPADFTY